MATLSCERSPRCEFLRPAVFVHVLFASQGFAGHKVAQNSQEELWNQPRLLDTSGQKSSQIVL